MTSFEFDPETRRLTNVTQAKTYEPLPLTPKEDEIRRTAASSRSAAASCASLVERARSSSFPTRRSRGR